MIATMRAPRADVLPGSERLRVRVKLVESGYGPTTRFGANGGARDVVGQRLGLRVRRAVTNHAQTVVSAEVTGDFDRRGLPDPLVVSFYFSTHDRRLVQLVILRNEIATRTL